MLRCTADETDRAHETAAASASAAPATDRTAQVLALQRTVGNRAARLQLSRAPEQKTIAGEAVMVDGESEEKEAQQLIDGMDSKYGVKISSAQGVKSTLATYKDAPEAERNKVTTRPWLLSELRALNRALSHFSPILGTNRAASTRKDVAQEVTTAGKATYSISANSASGAVDRTLGQYYRSDKNFTMYQRGEVSEIDFPGDKSKQQEATATHEIAHGVMEYALDGFMKASGFWTSRNQESGVAGAEAPPTKYGRKNAAEDLCESVMFYFVDPDRLKNGQSGVANGTPGNPCPKRFEYLKKVVGAWAPTPEPIKGDAIVKPVTDSSLVAV